MRCTQENTGLQCLPEEYRHTEGYYGGAGALTCQIEEHQHNDNCYTRTETLNCQIEEHQHNDNCYTWAETLTCQQEESETGMCAMRAVTTEPDIAKVYENEDYIQWQVPYAFCLAQAFCIKKDPERGGIRKRKEIGNK